jgi:hypothetical protein
MGIGVGLLLVALGAILKFGVSYTAKGLNIGTIGVVLMVVGVLGVVLDLVLFMPRRRRPAAGTGYVDADAPVVAQPVAGQPVVTQPVAGTTTRERVVERY